MEIGLIKKNEANYPYWLSKIDSPPEEFFFGGDYSVLNGFCVAIVGTRNPSRYGEMMAKKIVKDLAKYQVVIVSGLALGVDTIAHQTALECGLKTVAVLGSGIDNIYPTQNLELAEKISQSGVVISEFPRNLHPDKRNFPIRNRIISGLSLATVVVEAPVRSGSLITARLALEQNREVFVVPGDVDREQSQGVLELLRQGVGQPISSGAEVIAEIEKQRSLPLNYQEEKPVNLPIFDLGEREKNVLECFEVKNLTSVDLVARKLFLPIVEVLTSVSILEIKGLLIEQNGQYRRLR